MGSTVKNYQVSSGRQVTYYIGMVLVVSGILSFGSVFFMSFSPQTALSGVGIQDNCYTSSTTFSPPQLKQLLGVPECGSLEHRFGQYVSNPTVRAVGGMVLVLMGAFLMFIGQVGLRGSGIILDPQGARRDLEPFNRASGGMLQDALEEVPALGQQPQTVIKVKCRSCSVLNAENAKFCNQCGQVL
jgi:hypothetical protein